MKRVALPIACLLAALAGSASDAHAQARPATPQAHDADSHAAKGAALLKKKKVAEALAEYEQAYAASQDPKHILIVAKLRTQTEDAAGAARAYSEYLKSSPDAQHRGEAMGELQRLLSGIGRVNVKCDQPGVSIAVDGAPMTSTPTLEPILVTPGPHTLTATKAGFATVTRSVTAKAEDTIAISIDMTTASGSAARVIAPEPVVAKPAPAPAPPPPVAPAPVATPAPAPAVANAEPAPPPATAPTTKPGGSSRWIGWTAAGALAAGAVVTGIVAAGEASAFDDKKQTLGVTRAELEDAQTGARTWALVSAGLGVAAVGVLTITLLTSKSAPVTVGATPTSVRLAGSF
jgi:hypothetical protein